MKILWQDKSALALLLLMLASWLLVFWPSLVAMEAVWRGSDTYTHAYAVPFIILWLLTTSQQQLSERPTADWRLSLLLLPLLLLWIVGYAAEVAALSQLAAVLALQLLLISWLGLKLAWQLKFPIFYLIFLLPFGEELHPMLQDITADLTVFFLQLSSIPVFREGLYISTPVGHFEVAVACSGLRFLIASLAIGTLFAHLTFQSFRRQCLFMLALILVSVLANGLRAFVLILIAEQTNMAYGFGDDHYIYGWLVFGLVLLLMFYLGGKFTDFPASAASDQNATDSLVSADAATSAQLTPTQPKGCLHAALSISLCGLFWYWSQQLPIQQAPAAPAAALQWSGSISQSDSSNNWGIHFPHSQRQTLLSLPEHLSLFRAEFGHRQSEGELIGWANRLYHSKYWTETASRPLQLGAIQARLTVLKSLSGETRLLIHWYQVGRFSGYSELNVKLAQLQALLSTDTRPGQINAVSVLVTNQAVDEARLVQVATELAATPALPAEQPATPTQLRVEP
jgi:exosortase A